MLGGSFQLPTIAERAVIKSNQIGKYSSDNEVGSWGEPPNIIGIDGSEKRICRLGFTCYWKAQ